MSNIEFSGFFSHLSYLFEYKIVNLKMVNLQNLADHKFVVWIHLFEHIQGHCISFITNRIDKLF